MLIISWSDDNGCWQIGEGEHEIAISLSKEEGKEFINRLSMLRNRDDDRILPHDRIIMNFISKFQRFCMDEESYETTLDSVLYMLCYINQNPISESEIRKCMEE